MDNEMIERLVAVQMKHNPQTKIGAAIVVVELLTAMREPTERMKALGPEVQAWPEIIDAILND